MEVEVGPWMTRGLLDALADELGARFGDTVVLYPDGSVGMGRLASAAGSARITSHLLPSRPSPPAAWPHRRSAPRATAGPPLELVRREGRAAR